MIRDLGVVRPGTMLYLPFHTFDSNDPSASVTLTGLATTDVEIYKDGGTTQRASDNGYALLDTDGIDFDSVTGIHGISVDLADNSTAGFYASGSQYWVVISSVTVDAATINFVLATFRIGYAGSILDTTIATLASQTSFTLTTGPAEDDALNGRQVIIHDVASAVQMGSAVILDYTGSTKTVTLAAGTTFTAAATDNISVRELAPLMPTVQGRTFDVTSTGEGGIDWGNVGSPTTTLALTGTTIAVTQKVDVETIKTNPVVNAGTVTFPTTATLASTTNITAGTITTTTNLTNLPTIPTAWITADGIATDAIGSSELAASAITEIQSGLSTLDAAGIRTAVGLASANLDTQLTAIDDLLDTEVAAIKAKTDQLTFTAANKIDANVKAVNSVTVDGTGAAGDEWGPA